jgi:hypothetical protein
MKNLSFRFNVVALVLFLLSCQMQAATNGTVSPKAITTNEQLSYVLYYNLSFIWIKAGVCDFSIKPVQLSNGNKLKLMANGYTDPSFEAFFYVRDTFISYVDPSTLIPSTAFKFTHEDKWVGSDTYKFKKVEEGWEVTTQLMRKGQWKSAEISQTINGGFDLLTSIYRLRCMDNPALYKVGAKNSIAVRMDDGEYWVQLNYLGKQQVKLHKIGTVSAHYFQLSLVAGKVFKRGDYLKMWISDDGNHIPLMIESPIRVGKLKAVIESTKNTLFPITYLNP